MARMLRAMAPSAARLERRFRMLLQDRYDASAKRALLAITPAAAASQRSLAEFLESLEQNGRELARLGLSPPEVKRALGEFGSLLGREMEGRFAPAREQLHLVTILALNRAFYEVREAEAQAFFGLFRAEAEAGDFDDLLRRLVQVMGRTFRAAAARLLLLDEPPRGKLARPLYIEGGKPGERLVADAAMRGRFASYWSYPLGAGGLLQFGFRTSCRWLPREMTLMDAMARHCRQAIERARLERETRRLEAGARQAEEEERRRIGRELHDETGQLLMALRLELEMIERDATAPLGARIAAARVLAEHAVTELRRAISALSPAVLERLGLPAALRQLAVRFSRTHHAAVRASIVRPSGRLPRPAAEAIYRVAQEALQNVGKHARATRVNVSLRPADKVIRLRVSDNGAGFCAEEAWAKPMTFGLAGMRERAALLGGRLAVRSAPGKGTSVLLELPLGSAAVASDGKNSRTAN
jgi:signal transduction histidine kinase